MARRSIEEQKFLLDVFRKASFCRHFENRVFELIQRGKIKFPVYLSVGQEFIPATIATCYEHLEPDVFIQHRGHSTYLCFGGDPHELADELLGSPDGCASGMGGSASIQSIQKHIFGHDGLMGSHVPIAVGHCYTTKQPTIVFMGDAAAEEDYVLGALGWAATKKLPILFVVEDNDLSILTKKQVRRCWKSHKVARAFGMEAVCGPDDPIIILNSMLMGYEFEGPMLINVRTHRKHWHAGAGTDDPNIFDRYTDQIRRLGEDASVIHHEQFNAANALWETHLL